MKEIIYEIRSVNAPDENGNCIYFGDFKHELTKKTHKRKTGKNVAKQDQGSAYIIGPKNALIQVGGQYRFTGDFKDTETHGRVFEFQSCDPAFLTARIERVTYHNEENGYSVLYCSSEELPDATHVVGKIPSVAKGQSFRFYGEFVKHDKYGQQFRFSRYEETYPHDKEGVIAYFASSQFPGVGRSAGQKIYDQFGDDAIEILEKYPHRLSEVQGLGEKKMRSIRENWERNREVNKLYIHLQGCGLTFNMVTKIFTHYQHMSLRVLQTNPYRLIEDIDGIAFRTADAIAMKVGIAPDATVRLRAAAVYILERQTLLGHCYATQHEIVATGHKVLLIDELKMIRGINEAVKEGQIVREHDVYWLREYLLAERHVASYVNAILAGGGKKIDGSCVDYVLANGEVEYAEAQKDAVRMAAQEKMMILTGGPGTGKSTVARGIMDMFDRAGLKTLLAAPTGRAAKRLAEATGREARTIHRLLEYRPHMGFQRNHDCPLDCDVVMIDEASMVDIDLMDHLMEAILPECRLVLIGDADQLPSVGPGNVLHDLIDCGKVPVSRLQVIFRQAEGSGIIKAAYNVNNGLDLYPTGDSDSDFCYRVEKMPEVIADMVVQQVIKYIDGGVNPDDIQVLFPQKKNPHYICTNEMNERLQQELNPFGQPVENTPFRVGDKVMQLKNNYDWDIYNGDIGRVISADPDENRFSVKFDDAIVDYGIKSMEKLADKDELTLAYASTIHKAQGAEFPYVIMPFSGISPTLLCRNLFYTGITRAKTQLVLIGEPWVVKRAINNARVEPRKTMLKDRIWGM